jgi:N-acetylneuraminic acid mutarotase
VNGDSTTPSWYYAKAGAVDGQQAGPVSWEQLYSLAQAGALTPTDLVWNPQLPNWVTAAEIPGLVPPPRPRVRDISEEMVQPTAVRPAAVPREAARPAAKSYEPVRSSGAYDPFADDSDIRSTGGRRAWLRWALPLAAVVVAGVALGVYFGVVRGGGTTETTETTVATLETTTTSEGETTTTEGAPVPATQAVWTDLAPTGDVPSARSGHAAIYNLAAQKMLIFGGWNADSSFNETWSYDSALNTWTNLIPTGSLPAARAQHQMVYDSVNGKVIMFGGLVAPAGAQLGDTWAYDPVANTWANLNPTGDVPEARDSHSMVFDSATGQVILFGGWSDGTSTHVNDTWAYDPAANTWTNLEPTGDVPTVRGGQCMIYDQDQDRVILFGGWDESTYFNDIYAYDPNANTWTNLNPAGDVPSVRYGHKMVYDPTAGTVVLFGGYNLISEFDDTWAYDPVSNTWTDLYPAGTAPAARDSHSLIYDPAADKLILFGGYVDGAADLQDTWSFGIPAS